MYRRIRDMREDRDLFQKREPYPKKAPPLSRRGFFTVLTALTANYLWSTLYICLMSSSTLLE